MSLSSIEVVKTLAGIDLPASKHEIVYYAERQGAQPDLLHAISALPERRYHTISGVKKAVQEHL